MSLRDHDGTIGLTLFEPWASLVADRIKTVETRTWRHIPMWLVGRWLAIHAASNFRIGSVKAAEAEIQKRWGVKHRGPYRRGAIIAVAEVGAVSTQPIPMRDACLFEGPEFTENGIAYCAEAARWGIWLDSVSLSKIDPPIPCKGAQQLWKVPEEVDALIGERLV